MLEEFGGEVRGGADANDVRVARRLQQFLAGQRHLVVLHVGVAVAAKGIDGGLVHSFQQKDLDLSLI